MFSLIFALAILVIVLLFVGVGLLIGRKYVWIYSVAKVAALVVTAPLTVLLASLAARGVGALVKTLLVKSGAMGSFATLLGEIPSLGDALVALVAIVLAPLLFYVIFLILRPILYKIARIIVKRILLAKGESASDQVAEEVVVTEETAEAAEEPVVDAEATETKKEKKKKKKKYQVLRATGINPLGMACGAAGGLLMALILLSPFVGFLTVADRAIGVADDVSDLKVVEKICEVTDAAANNVSSKAVHLLGGKLVYRGLTTYPVGETKVSLSDEIGLVESVGEAVGAVKDRTVERAVAAGEVREISESFAQTDLIPTVVPELLRAANGSWENGQSFHGLQKPAVGGATVAKVLDPVYSLLATSDSETMKADVNTILDVIAILVEEDALGSVKSNPMALVSNEKVTAEALRALLQNERTKPLVGELMQIGVDLLGDKLELRDNMNGLYDELMRDAAQMAQQAQNAEDVNGALLAGYTELMDTYGLDLSKESLDALVTGTAAIGAVGEDSIKALFANTPLTLNGGRTVTLSSEEAVADTSVLVSMDELTFDSSVIAADESEIEAKALAKVLSEMASMVDLVKGDGFSSATTIRDLGALMDALAATKTVGKENTDRLLMGMLQSEKIHDQIGFSVLEATEVAQSIAQNSVNGGYVSVMKALGNTIEIVQMSSKNENINEKMDVLLKDLTAESATVLQTMAKPSVMTSHGVPERSAESSATMMSSMFGNLADAKASGMSDEEYQKEAKAVADMTNMAMKASTSDSDKVFGEGGIVNGTAEEYVGNVFDSKVMSKTLVETVYPDETGVPVSDPLNTQKNLNEQENAELMDALNNQWANATEEEKADPEYKKTYYAIGSLMNVDSTQIDAIFGGVQA